MTATAFVLATAVLAYTGFCRLVHVDLGTRLHVRLAVYLMTVAALSAQAAVVVWGYEPGWPSAALAICMALVQVVSSHLWRDGVPQAYRRRQP